MNLDYNHKRPDVETGESEVYKNNASRIAEMGKAILARVLISKGNHTEKPRGDVYPNGKGERDGLDFMIKIYTNDYSFEVHQQGADIAVYQVVNQGQSLEGPILQSQGMPKEEDLEQAIRASIRKPN